MILWTTRISKEDDNLEYTDLLIEADTQGLTVKEKRLHAYDGRIKGNRIAIRIDMPTTQKTCVLAEELGHHHTGYGNILQPRYKNRALPNRVANLIDYDFVGRVMATFSDGGILNEKASTRKYGLVIYPKK